MNWYKMANADKKPYRIYKVGNGKEIEVVSLKYIYAISSEQARLMALQRDIGLNEFLAYCRRSNSGCDVVARLDVEKWREIQEFQDRKKKQKEEEIQEAWWQK